MRRAANCNLFAYYASRFTFTKDYLFGTIAAASVVVHHRTWAVALLVAFTSHCRFQFRFLSGRDKVSMFLQIFDNFFGHHLTLKPTQGAFDRFVVID